jgi:MFS family permease
MEAQGSGVLDNGVLVNDIPRSGLGLHHYCHKSTGRICNPKPKVSNLPQTIAQRLNGSSTAAFWVGTSYLLTCAVCQPFISALSDVFGRAPLLIVVLIFFTVGSLTASLARGLSTLLIARSIQGIGGGGIITMTLVVVSDIIPLRHRPRWYGIIQAAWAIGTAAGPFLGGLFVQYSSWRWIFYVNLPLCGVGLIAAPFSVRTQAARGSLKEKLSRVDWIGGAAFTASLTSFLMAISWGGVQYK